ncbi:unnamed protein product [Peniophora sp. CBMAI 1063]|nr:unnamed protein product [Peniophora sp. CBMAI 1063]
MAAEVTATSSDDVMRDAPSTAECSKQESTALLTRVAHALADYEIASTDPPPRRVRFELEDTEGKLGVLPGRSGLGWSGYMQIVRAGKHTASDSVDSSNAEASLSKRRKLRQEKENAVEETNDALTSLVPAQELQESDRSVAYMIEALIDLLDRVHKGYQSERNAREMFQASEEQMATELSQLQASGIHSRNLKRMKRQLETTCKEAAALKSALYSSSLALDEAMVRLICHSPRPSTPQSRLEGLQGLDLASHLVHPMANYVHFCNIFYCSAELVVEHCWKGTTFVIGYDAPPLEDVMEEIVIGRIDHSPGLPLIPGQPGAIMTHDIDKSSFGANEPVDLVVLWPTADLPADGDLLTRYLGQYESASDWEIVPKEDWKNFSDIVRQNWCKFLANPYTEAGVVENNDWTIAARISLRKAGHLTLDGALVSELVEDMDAFYNPDADSDRPGKPSDVTPEEVDDALSAGQEVLYFRILKPLKFDLKVHEKLQTLDAERMKK